MALRLSVVDAAHVDNHVQKPFDESPGFTSSWWIGWTEAPVSWYRVSHETLGEVARVQLKPESPVGLAYPTWTVPPSGALEVDLLEVRSDLQHKGLGIGRAAIGLVQMHFAGPYAAISLDSESDKFWRSLCWSEHVHEGDEHLHPDALHHTRLFTSFGVTAPSGTRCGTAVDTSAQPADAIQGDA